MSKFTGDSASENLSLMLDGELAQSQEVPLFTELASNDELRTEMRDMLAVKNTVRNDSEAFVPPIAAASAVFSSAGYALPGAFALGLKTLLTKYLWLPVLTAAIAGLSVFFIFRDNYDNQMLKAVQENQLLKAQLSKSNTELSKIQSENERLLFEVSRIPETNEIIRYIRVPVVSSMSSENKVDENKVSNNNTDGFDREQVLLSESKPNYKTISSQDINSLYSGSIHSYTDGRIENRYSPIPNKISTDGLDYMLTFRGMAGMTYPQVSTTTSPEMSNFALGMFFKTSYPGIRIGMEFGHEPFSQKFNNTENGMKYSYEQMPNLWWGGAGVVADFNYEIDEIFGARPYGKLFLGASEIGPLGKIGAGFQWFSASWGLGAFLGIEGSLLGYENQGSWYTSEKIGITYGLSIQF